MTTERAHAYKKHRAADDRQGNLTWALRLTSKAIRASPESARLDVEKEFELSEEERLLWRLLRWPRRYVDMETSGVMGVEEVRGFLRGLVAADVVDVVESAEAKALVPIELERLRRELRGEAPPPRKVSGGLKPRVYRPPVAGLDTPPPTSSARAPAKTEAPRRPPANISSSGPTVSSPAALTPDEVALKKEIEAKYAAMKGQSHYAFLEVDAKADEAAIRVAYVKKARELHPDRVAGTSLSSDSFVVRKIDGLFKRLQEAQTVLLHPEQRVQYDKQLASGGGVPSGDSKKVRRPEEAAVVFAKGEHYLKRNDFKEAEAHFQLAAELDGEDPKILTHLAWAIYSNRERDSNARVVEARRMLLDVVARHENWSEAYYRLGLLERARGDEEAAEQRFRDTVKRSPKHVEATRELRLLQQRRKAQEATRAEERGLLGRFLKR